MSISLCFNKTVLSGLYIYYNISKCTSCTHVKMFLIESQLGVHTLKDKRRAKELNKLYKTIESK